MERLAAESESNLPLLRLNTAQSTAAPAVKCYVCNPAFQGQGKRVSAPSFCISLCLSTFCKIHLPQSCGGLLFPEMLSALQVFLTKVVVWCVEAAFPVSTSVCLQLQLSLSKQVLYQMVTCNYFTLSPLNCPVLRPGNKTSIIFVLFPSGSMQRQNVKYGVSSTWVYSGKSSGLFFSFLSLYGMDFK